MKNSESALLQCILVPLLVVLSVAASFAPKTAFGEDGPGAWSLTNQLGKEVSSSSLAGKVMVVNFWSTTCLPCLCEMPALHDVAKEYDKSVNVVSVSVDAKSSVMLQAFANEFKMNYTVGLANPGILHGFGVADIVPMTFILDQQGKIVRKHVGYVDKAALEKDIRSVLKF